MNEKNAFNDFNEYVNGQWMKNTKMPIDKSEWGTFHIVHENNINKIDHVLQKLITDVNNKHCVIGKLYKRLIDGVDGKSVDANISNLKNTLDTIDGIITLKDMGEVLGSLTKIDINPFFQTSATEDPKNTNIVKFTMWSPNLSMPEKGYYTKREFKHYVEDFKKNIINIFEFIYGSVNMEYVDDIIMIETFIAHVLKSVETQRNVEKMYHKTNMRYFFETLYDVLTKQTAILNGSQFLTHWTKVKVKESTDIIQFWLSYFETAGLKNIDEFIVYDISFFRKISVLMNMLPIQKLKIYVKYVVIKNTDKTLIPKLDDILFDFFGKKLQGQQYPTSHKQLIIELLSKYIGDVIGKEYVNIYFDDESRVIVSKMVQNIKHQMMLSIKNLDWMSEKTKENSILKLNKFRVKIGYPDVWKNRDDLLIHLNKMIENQSLFELLNVIKKYNYDKFMIDLIDTKQDPDKWSMNPHDVNAYYDPQRNEIVFPAGILDTPFFDKNHSYFLGKNYGGIGTIIGHEITHGYDDQGRKYDHNGNFSNQWLQCDIEKYEILAERMVNQYNQYIIENHNVNGRLTLGENIADLGGVTLAFRALCSDLSKSNLSDALIEKHKKDFFTGYAELWKNITKPEKIISYLLSNPHSPGKYRVWVVRNLDDFYEIFKDQIAIDDDDKNSMYLSPRDRIKIW